MRKAKLYILNGLIVSAAALILRFAGMAYNVYISGKLGAEGMGLLSLILSVYNLAVTFASSGVNLTCTRLVADALALNNPKEAGRALGRCTVYSLFFGLFSATLLFSLSSFLGTHVLSNPRTVLCLRALCPALPISALTACFSGYFTATRRVYKTAFSSIIEQILKILFTSVFFSLLLSKNMGVESVMFSSCLSELTTFVLLCLILRGDLKNKLPKTGEKLPGLTQKLLHISLPIAFAAWVRSALVTAEHVLIPRGLTAYGKENALATYGVMHGMALPVIFFPYAILSPFSSLLMPEISRFKAEKKEKNIAFCASLMLRMTLLFGLGCSFLLIFFGRELGQVMYNTEGVGTMISLFAFLIPVMYTDTAADSVLKGLGEQVYCMKVNIADAALSLLMVFFLVPRVGAYGYVLTVFVSECFNTFFSILRLRKKVALHIPLFSAIALPALCALTAAFLSRKLFLLFGVQGWIGMGLALLLFLSFYVPLLFLSKALRPEDRRYFGKLFKGGHLTKSFRKEHLPHSENTPPEARQIT